MEKRNLKGNNKGFTLVELIVVLVILAILAAILVPALLGYIDSARNKQTLLNARSAMTAAQAELSAIYGSPTAVPGDIVAGESHNANLTTTMDQNTLKATLFVVGVSKEYKDETQTPRKTNHECFTVNYIEYTDGTGSAYFYQGEWFDKLPTNVTGVAKKYYVIGTAPSAPTP